MGAKESGSSIIAIIIIGLLIWWFFIRVDYKDVWWSGTETQRVINCGQASDPHCSTGQNYYLAVTHLQRSGNTHYFEINFDNGGHIETAGECDEAAKGAYPFDRFCRTTTNDGRMFIIAPM